MLPNIVLIGFMGSGKSSAGRRLAALTGHRFVDTDDMIVEAAGMQIPDIFRQRGEPGFRNLETERLSELVGVCGVVLATGGGLVLREENRGFLREIGTIAWLDATPGQLFERVSRNARRPLLQTENPRETFDNLLAQRMAVYRDTADFRVDTSNLNTEQTARLILERTRRFHHQHSDR